MERPSGEYALSKGKAERAGLEPARGRVNVLPGPVCHYWRITYSATSPDGTLSSSGKLLQAQALTFHHLNHDDHLHQSV